MPFTPLHLGPGLLLKAALGHRFSVMVFGGTQVLMDIEPGLGMLRGWPVLHGYTHTLPGALVIGSVAGVIGRPTSDVVLRRLGIGHAPFTWSASFLAAYVGSLSHVALDAVMHADMVPFWPWSEGNPWLRALSMETLHLACVALIGLGGLLLGAQALVRSRRGSPP